MIFTLEAVKAKEGDSLILHYGDPSEPCISVIDGGPPGGWKGLLAPGLETIRAELPPGKPLPLEVVGISHIDADHIAGILSMLQGLIRARERGEEPLVAP